MGLITLVSSLVLSYSYSSLKALSEENVRLDVQKNIIKSVGIDISKMSKDEILKSYSTNINEIILDQDFNAIDDISWNQLVGYEDKKSGTTYFINKIDISIQSNTQSI